MRTDENSSTPEQPKEKAITNDGKVVIDDRKPRRKSPPVTVTNVTGDGKPNMLPLDGDSEVARAYRDHLDKRLVRADEKDTVAEQVTLYLAICREQSIAFDYSAKGVDLHHAATGALFYNHKGHEVVTPKGRNVLAKALAGSADVRTLCLMLQGVSKALADAPRTEREQGSQSKVDLAQLISSLAAKSDSPEELAAALLKLIK